MFLPRAARDLSSPEVEKVIKGDGWVGGCTANPLPQNPPLETGLSLSLVYEAIPNAILKGGGGSRRSASPVRRVRWIWSVVMHGDKRTGNGERLYCTGRVDGLVLPTMVSVDW